MGYPDFSVSFYNRIESRRGFSFIRINVGVVRYRENKKSVHLQEMCFLLFFSLQQMSKFFSKQSKIQSTFFNETIDLLTSISVYLYTPRLTIQLLTTPHMYKKHWKVNVYTQHTPTECTTSRLWVPFWATYTRKV